MIYALLALLLAALSGAWGGDGAAHSVLGDAGRIPGLQTAEVATIRVLWGAESETALCIAWYESRWGTDPRTYDLSRPDGGLYQLHRYVWEPYFARWGERWEEIVGNDVVNILAAYHIWERTGGSFGPWSTKGECE